MGRRHGIGRRHSVSRTGFSSSASRLYVYGGEDNASLAVMLPDGTLRCITWQMSNKTIKLSHTVPGDNLNWIADAVFLGK